MSVLLVTYDLDEPSRNYDGLIKAIKKRTWCHALDSVWYLDTADDPATVRDELGKELDKGDQFMSFDFGSIGPPTRRTRSPSGLSQIVGLGTKLRLELKIRCSTKSEGFLAAVVNGLLKV